MAKAKKKGVKGKAAKSAGVQRMDLPVDKLRLEAEIQTRVELDNDRVVQFAEAMRAGKKFPPISVCYSDPLHYVIDGFHRTAAASLAGVKFLPAEVWVGDRKAARWAAAAANKEHDDTGLHRTNADKAKAVLAALKSKPDLSDRAIAEHVGVSPTMVASHRATANSCSQPDRTGRDGRTIDTANIGKSVDPPPDPDAIPMGDDEQPDGHPAAAPVAPAAKVHPACDQVGQVLDVAVVEAFARREEITHLMTVISDVKVKVTQAVEAKDPLFAALNHAQFVADCANIHRALRACRPHAACPYCRQMGCKACLDRGWVGEFVYNAAPAALKHAAAAGAAAVDPEEAPPETDGEPGKPIGGDPICSACGEEAETLYTCVKCGGAFCEDCIATRTLVCEQCNKSKTR
jgi:hypothetical protein